VAAHVSTHTPVELELVAVAFQQEHELLVCLAIARVYSHTC